MSCMFTKAHHYPTESLENLTWTINVIQNCGIFSTFEKYSTVPFNDRNEQTFMHRCVSKTMLTNLYNIVKIYI